MPSDLLENLNPKQLEAVTAPEESVLILAGAGSGKTRVLTTRVAWLLEEHLATTSEILAVTFTNKAAKEMVTRLESMLPYDLKRMWIGTFHGLCNRILRRHAEYAGLPKSFQIIDSADQLAMVKRIMKAANVDPERTDPRSVTSFINWMKEQGVRAAHSGSIGGADNSTKVDLYRAYESECQKQGVVDFAELLLRCYELLERNELVRVHYQQRFRHILVDEFQDTNVLQYRWLKLLAGTGLGPDGGALNSVFAVGDDDQSIYAFRGANVGNMTDFIKDFHVKNPIRLEQNYRSTKAILDAANGLIEQNEGRLGKNLWTAGDSGEKITVKELDTDIEEARWVADQMENARHKGAKWRDFAVLYRTNAQSRSIETELSGRGIPYRVYGGLRFFERAEVKNVLGYLRMITNPWDDTSFLRVVNTPTRGIGAKSIEVLQNAARERGISLWAALTDRMIEKPAKLMAFENLITQMRIAADGMPLLEAINHVIKASGLEEAARKEKEGDDRVENMREVISAAKGWLENEKVELNHPAFAPVSDDSPSPMEGFLTQATLEAGDRNENADQDAVQLMTVHSAKGLEFPWVWIIGAEEGLFPHFSAIKTESKGSKGGGIEEERRLMYVAITRAKKHLTFTHARERLMFGNAFKNPLSSFVNEIPQSLLDIRPANKKKVYQPSYEDEDQDEKGWGRSWGSSSRSGRSQGRGGYGSSSSYGRSSSMGSGDSMSFRGTGQFEAMQKKAAEQSGYNKGDVVKHDAFGEGVVKKFIGTGTILIIEIDFGKAGTKDLLLSFARDKLHLVRRGS